MKKSDHQARREPHHITHDAAEPVVIHHHDDRTALAHWVSKAAERGPRYWLTVAGVIAAAFLLVSLVSSWLSRPAPDSRAWFELMVPSTVAKGATTDEGMPAAVQSLLKIAEQNPNTSAARWALVRAGTLLYEEGLVDLPARRDVARPRLAQAIEQFNRVVENAPEGAPEALVAALSKARALETRGELDDAIAAYQDVAKKWPKTDQADFAEKRATMLARPDVKKFYEDFYALDFSNVFPPSGGPVPGGVPSPLDGKPEFGTPLIPPLPVDAPVGTDAKPAAGDAAIPATGLEAPKPGDAAKPADAAAGEAPPVEKPAEAKPSGESAADGK